jgi:hypothetical protein
MIAEYADMESMTGLATRLADDTWLRADLMVFCAGQAEDGYIKGPPLLAVEVTSPASRRRDLTAKKELFARHGVPCYWVIDLDGDDLWMYVFELEGEAYVECAVLGVEDSCRVTEPFKFDIRPGELFARLPPWRGPMEGTDIMLRNGPDLPEPEDIFEVDTFRRWPTGAEKIELAAGCPVFYGQWDERDVLIAQRAYPGRTVRLDQQPGRPGTMTVLPASTDVEAAAEPRRTVIKIEVPGDV